MRKTICILLVLCTLFFIVGCSGSKQELKMDDKYYQLGIKALNVVDGYLGATVSAEDAAASIESIYQELEWMPELDTSTDIGLGNSIVKTDISILNTEFSMPYSSGGVSYADILEARDSLAHTLGKPNYK